MSATPPEADLEYSRGPEPERGSSRARFGRQFSALAGVDPLAPGPLRAGILIAGLLGATLMLVAEFTSLLEVRVGTTAIRTVSTGSHQGYALAPAALLVAALAVAVYRTGSRPALLAIGLLGTIALLIALLGDLPDAKATGLVLRGGRYVTATSTPQTGMYMETLGAVLLLITAVCGFMLAGTPPHDTGSPDFGSSS